MTKESKRESNKKKEWKKKKERIKKYERKYGKRKTKERMNERKNGRKNESKKKKEQKKVRKNNERKNNKKKEKKKQPQKVCTFLFFGDSSISTLSGVYLFNDLFLLGRWETFSSFSFLANFFSFLFFFLETDDLLVEGSFSSSISDCSLEPIREETLSSLV